MRSADNRSWIRAVLLAAAFYLLIGRVFPLFGGREWRAAAWLLAGVAFAAHIWYEHFMLRNAHRAVAFHAALGVAIGAFGLAAAAMITSLVNTSVIRPVWFVALLLWPTVTAIPAFVVALFVAALLSHFRPIA